jgi:flagellar hook-associated protein 1 FlgK
MSVSALSSAISGLRASQAGMGLIAQNVANADNPNYTRKSLESRTQAIGERVVGVRSTTAQRSLDTLLQRTLRTEVAGGSYADVRARYMDRLDALYGPPGSGSALDAMFSAFTGALQGLATSPESPTARGRVLSEANILAQRINGISEDIQALRLETEQGIGDAVARLNDALQRLSSIDRQIIANSGGGGNPVNLLDQRDAAINEIARLVDVRVDVNQDNSVAVFTRSGMLLYDRMPVVLEFDQRASLTPNSVYDTNAAVRSVGTIMLRAPNGLTVDMLAQGAFRAGEIAGLVSLRDDVLPNAQRQLDEFAAGLARSLSDRAVAGTATTLGAQAGFSLDVTALQPGDAITLTIRDGATARTVSIVRVDDPTMLPLPQTATARPDDQVIGISFAGGSAAAAAAIQTALGANFQVDSPVAGTIRFLDDGAPNLSDVTAASAIVTETSLAGTTAALPIFGDIGRSPPIYSGSFEGRSQLVGFAQRIGVNPSLAADPSRLVLIGNATAVGDPTRPNALLDRLTKSTRLFGATDGLGSPSAPPSATVASFVQRMVASQGQQAETAKRLSEGQEVVVNGLQTRFDASARVNIDEEMARLIELQQTFQASARIISTVDEMMRALLQT